MVSHGGQFSEEAAQYASDTIDADWNANALGLAGIYSDIMHMSEEVIFDQLTAEYGDKFTAEQADDAIENLNS